MFFYYAGESRSSRLDNLTRAMPLSAFTRALTVSYRIRGVHEAPQLFCRCRGVRGPRAAAIFRFIA